MKVLLYGESPVITTGLASVSRVICDALVEEGHEVAVVGTNHHLVVEYDHSLYPYTIHPILEIDKSNPNVFSTAFQHIVNDEFDVLIISTDFGRDIPIYQAVDERRNAGRDCFVIGYYAVDCDRIPRGVFNSLYLCNCKIVYTEHAKRVIESTNSDFAGLVNVIPLATRPDLFYPLSNDEKRAARQEIFNIVSDDTFLVVSVNRNQGRKDLGRLMMIFHEFHKRHPNSLLYMHCQKEDQGGDLWMLGESIGMTSSLDHPEVVYCGNEYSCLAGYDPAFLNRIYNAADCFLSTSTGEGWGLSIPESMCAGTPVVVPANTASRELVGVCEERGWLIKTGGDIDHQIVLYGLSSNPRDIVWSESAIEKLELVYSHPWAASLKLRAAREWCINHDEAAVKQVWKKLFSKIETEVVSHETLALG